jgi:BirA family biotin operon repressor/biotin-[acetyl-CoA-carboxylase] ligase
VALCEAIRESTGFGAVIKWPNDLLAPIGRRKLAGILVEGSSSGRQVDYAVLGFGLNIRARAYPPEIRGHATSLEEELGRAVDAESVLDFCLAALDRRYRDLHEGRGADVLARWSELSPDARGTNVEWVRGDVTRRGVTAGIDQSGALLVLTDEGLERIVSGEVTWCFSR